MLEAHLSWNLLVGNLSLREGCSTLPGGLWEQL